MNKQTLIRGAVVLPSTIIALIGLWSFAMNASGGWVWTPDTVTLPEAVATGNYAELARQLEAGADPNAVDGIRAGVLGGKATQLTPLQTAVWGRNPIMVKMLLERGAIVGPTSLAVLKCINDESVSADVRALLDAVVSESGPPCSELRIPR